MEGSSEQDDTMQRKAEKMDRLLKDPMLRPLLDDLCQWLARILQIDISSENFTVPLQTGDDLCRLALAISKKAAEMEMKCPTVKYKAGAKPGSFQARCNIEAFVKWAKALGVRETCLFETVDIVELKYLRNVLICLLEISKLADVYGVEPPELVKLEKSTKIGWQDLIKLSMKRTSSRGKVMSVADIASAVGTIQQEVEHAHEQGDEGLDKRGKSAVKKWKSYTKKSLKRRAEAVSTSPSKRLDESSSSTADFGTPDSTLEITEEPRSPPGRSSDLEVLEVGDVFMAEPVVETAQSPITDTEGYLTTDTEGYLTADTEGYLAAEPQTETDINFEDVTQERDSEYSEIVLSLEEVVPPDEDEIMVEELAIDDQDLGLSVEQNLVGPVHSQPDFYVALNSTLPEQDDQDLGLTVEQNLVEAVHSQPDINVALDSTLTEQDDQDLGLSAEQNLVEAVHSQPDFYVALDSTLPEQDDQDLGLFAEQNLVEPVHSEPDFYVAPDSALTEQDKNEVFDVVDVGIQGDGGNKDTELKEVEESGAGGAPDFSNFSVTIGQADSVSEASTPTQIAIMVHRSDSALSSPSGTPNLTRWSGSAQLAGDSEQVGGREDGYTNLAYEGDHSSLESAGSGSLSSTSQPTSQQPPSLTRWKSLETSSEVPLETSEDELIGSGLTRVTWVFALFYPAVYANKGGSALTDEQYEDLEWKRSVFLLLGILFTIIGTATAVTIGVLGPAGAGSTGLIPMTIFFILLAVALVCLIIGLSLLSLWVVQHFKIKNRKLVEYDSLPSYGSIK